MSGSEIIERAGVSMESFTDAVKNVIEDINRTRKVSWFQVMDQRGRVTPEGEVEYQVIIRIGL